MQGCVFHIRFNRTCNAYTHHETISHLDSVAADIVDNSDSNTLLALVAVTKALGEAAQKRLDDEDKREAVPEQSRMLLIPTMAFPFHPAYYVQEPTLSVPVVLTDYEQSRLNNIRANKEALKALNLFAGLENTVLLDVHEGRKKKGQLQREKNDPVRRASLRRPRS